MSIHSRTGKFFSKGSALLLAMVFMGVSMLSVAMFHTQIRTLLKLTDNPNFAEAGINAQHKAMGAALALIESGTPPDGYTCKLATTTARPEETALIYDLLNEADREWRVITSTDAVRLSISSCTCPQNFSDSLNFWSNCP